VAALAIELAEKVVGSNLDREANTRLIEDYINSVGAR
jgi:F0F1-type ATP synthase membrane subunit b/b'